MPVSCCGRGSTWCRRGGKALVQEIRASPPLASSLQMVFVLIESFPWGRNPSCLASPVNPPCCFLLHLVFCFRLLIAVWCIFPTVQCIRSCAQAVIFSLYYFSPSFHVATFYWLWSLSHSPAMLGQLNFCGCLCKLRALLLTWCLEHNLSKNVDYI